MDPGISQLKVGVEEAVMSVRREESGVGLGEGYGKNLDACPVFDAGGMLCW